MWVLGDYQISDNELKVQSSPLMKIWGSNVNGQADFGRKVTATLSRNGDLVHRIYLQATIPAVECPCVSLSKCFRWVNYIGHALIKSVEIEIGGQRIDKQYGDWLNIWNELTQEPGKKVGYDNMVGNTIFLTGTGLSRTEATTLYIPFQFWLNIHDLNNSHPLDMWTVRGGKMFSVPPLCSASA